MDCVNAAGFFYRPKDTTQGHCNNIIVWFQKISIPPPRKTFGNSEGEGGLKGNNFRRVGGFRGELVFQRITNHVQNIESNIRSI